jgi:hypothetical protein
MNIPGSFLGDGSVNTFTQQTDTNATMVQQQRNGVFYVVRVSMLQRELSSVRESVKRGLEPGGGGIVIVGAVTKKRIVTY